MERIAYQTGRPARPPLARLRQQVLRRYRLSAATAADVSALPAGANGLGATLTNTTVGQPGRVPSYNSLLTATTADKISIAILLVGYIDIPALIKLSESIQIAELS